MAFACQRNSYLKELVSKVVSCVRVKEKFEVVLSDTVLFPEGGGQPDDHGVIGDSKVTKVLRRGPEAVHIVDKELTVGDDYKCEIDWTRRFDHMQQHSAQHLLSAIADNKYAFKTISWNLGENISHVELNTSKISTEQISSIENECNQCIRQSTPVVVHYLTKEEALGLEEVKTRGLPEDVVEPIRVIEIKGVEKNMCCGTHVSNLCDLQVIKLLHTEPMRGGIRLFFLAGNRVIQKLGQCYDAERKLTKLLSCGPEDHAESVDKLKNSVRSTQKSCKAYLKEIAKFEALEKLQRVENSGYIFHHREDGDQDYIFTFVNNLGEKGKELVVFVAVGAVKTGGQFLMRGPEDAVATLSTSIKEIIDGKGGGKKDQLQGKAGNFKRIAEIEELLKTYVQSKSNET